MSKNDTENKSSFINIPALLAAYRRRWMWVGLSAVVFLLLGYVVCKRAQGGCEVNAQVLVSDEHSTKASSVGDIASMFGGGSFGSNRSVEDEMVIIKAHSLLRQTAVQLDMNEHYWVKKNFVKWDPLYYNVPIRLVYDHAIADTLSVPLTFEIAMDKADRCDVTVRGAKKRIVGELKDVPLPTSVDTPYGVFTLTPGLAYVPGKALHERIVLNSYDGEATSLSRQLNVDYSAKKTDIMQLSFVTADAQFGKEFINKLVNNYNALTIKQKQDFNVKTLEFLNERIAILSAEVDSSQQQVQQFLGNKDLVNPEAQASIIMSRTDRQEVELTKAEAEYQLLRMAIEFLSNEANNTAMLPIMPSTQSLTPLIAGYNDLILQRLAIEASAKGDNAALRAINTRIRAVRDNLLTALNKQSETSTFEIAEMRRQFGLLKSKLETVPGIAREYTDIMRQQNLKEQLYVYLLRQREETEMAIAGAHPRGVIIDEAYVTDTVIGMSPKVVLAVFLLLGLAIPAGVILLYWVVSRRVCTVDQAVDLSGGRAVIASLPLGTGEAEPVVATRPDSEEARRVRILRGNLLASTQADPGHTWLPVPLFRKMIAVTGTCRDDSATRVAVNLAASLALAGRPTVLVEADVDAPRVASMLGLRAPVTLRQAVGNHDAVPVTQVTIPGTDSSFGVICMQPGDAHVQDFIASIEFKLMVNHLVSGNDYVIILTPDAGGDFASVELIDSRADFSLAVFGVGKSLKADMSRLASLEGAPDNSYLVEVSGC